MPKGSAKPATPLQRAQARARALGIAVTRSGKNRTIDQLKAAIRYKTHKKD